MKKQLFYRRKGLLLLLQKLGPVLEKMIFQKYLFLWTSQQEKPIYDFVPYKYGCFSFQSYRDMALLKSLNYIHDEEKTWSLTNGFLKEGIDEKDFKRNDLIYLDQIKNEYKSMNTNALIKKIYLKYPYYAINSEKAVEILTQKELELVNSKKPQAKEKSLFTIGYEGRSIEAYLNFLIKNNIKALCDVRKNPLSRKYGFSKNELKRICEKMNIEYVRIPELGIESNLRMNLNSTNDYRNLFKVYKKTTLVNEEKKLQIVINLLNKKKRVAITCFEKGYKMCHRNCISEFIHKKTKIKVINI